MFSFTKTYTLLLTLSLSTLFSNAADPDSLVSMRTHSIFAPYVDQDLQNRWFDFGGEAYVNTNKHIRITQDRPSETGWLWSRLPITATNYQVDIEFKISGTSSHLFGDGMAIWLTKARAEYGPVFGSADNFEGVGVFLDTYANSRHSYSFPRVVGMIGDGKTSYDLGNDGDSNAAGACSAGIRRNDIKTKIRLIYKKDEGLKVLLQYKGWDDWTECFHLKDLVLPSLPYLGVTAITGEVHDNHDIISIQTYAINHLPTQQTAFIPKEGKAPSESGSWFSLIFKLFLVAGVGAGCYQAYVVYYKQHGRWNNKRF